MRAKQTGAVLIITLWTITMVTILVTVIASGNRLTARAAFYHQEELSHWASVLGAVNQAEMELMLERMPRPPEVIEDLSEINRNPLYRYNGRALDLAYPQDEDVVVRIYDHAGKINLRQISRPRMRTLLENLLGEDQDERIDRMIAAWSDWRDLNDGSGVNGAERDYYQSLDVPYIPRNGRMETVDEILGIRGFAEAFEGINLEAAFTLYTDNELVNLNLATVEAMRLLPGLNDELIERILAYRQENDIRGNADVAQLVPQENMAELRPWLNSRKTSSFYTITAYHGTGAGVAGAEAEAGAGDGGEDELTLAGERNTNAFSEIVEIRSFTEPPQVLQVNPYEQIPVRVIVQSEEDFLP